MNHRLSQHLEGQGFQPHNADKLMAAPAEPFNPARMQDTLANATRIIKNNEADHKAEIKAHGITRSRLLSTQDRLADAKHSGLIWSFMYFLLLAFVAGICLIGWLS